MWETTKINIGGKNPADIENQVRFIDTVKCFQQSLESLNNSMTVLEREKIKKICRQFLSDKLMFLTEKDEEWVLDYLSSGKGMISYQMITDFNSLEIKPEHGGFFKHSDFYSSLKERNISDEKYENVKRFFTVLRLKTLGDLHRIYNFQDTAILCEIFKE